MDQLLRPNQSIGLYSSHLKRSVEQNRRIRIEEARANLEAEKLNAEAEVERAKGAAQAIKIENGSLSSKYIQYLWVRQQSTLNNKTVIYIPTEANLPILEAGKRNPNIDTFLAEE